MKTTRITWKLSECRHHEDDKPPKNMFILSKKKISSHSKVSVSGVGVGLGVKGMGICTGVGVCMLDKMENMLKLLFKLSLNVWY